MLYALLIFSEIHSWNLSMQSMITPKSLTEKDLSGIDLSSVLPRWYVKSVVLQGPIVKTLHLPTFCFSSHLLDH